MTIDMEFILFVLCLWSAIATGMAIFYRQHAITTERMLLITMLGIKRVAEGKAKLSLNADGTLKFEGANDGNDA